MSSTDVVIVDPHKLIRAGFSLILQGQGFNVVAEGADGEQAVSLVRQHQPDVVCLAASASPSNGFDATVRIRNLEGIRQPCILMLAGSRDGDVRSEALAAGADAVVAKYATPEAIVMSVRAVLATRATC